MTRLCLVAVVSLLGCSNELLLSPDLPLKLEVSLDRQVLTPGDTARITLTITNPSLSSRTIQFPTTCQLSFQVRSPLGVPVAPLDLACGGAITYRTFSPGVETAEFTWSGEPTPRSPGRVAPGEYLVVAGLGLPPVAESPPVSLRVE